MKDSTTQTNLRAASAILAGLRLEQDVICRAERHYAGICDLSIAEVKQLQQQLNGSAQ